MSNGTLKAPMPYFGGKSRIAALVWERFGRVDNYVESFFGSGAMLLGCPHPGHTETVNDADGLLANFWRALQLDPDAVAFHADWPVNEVDLHARHRWLVDRRSLVEELMADPEWYDAKAAGWWVWGISQWIGTGWCPARGAASSQMPHLYGDSGASGRGVHAKKLQRGITKDGGLWQQRPSLAPAGSGGKRSGMGVHRAGLHCKRPAIGGRNGPSSVGGVHAARLSQKMPKIGANGTGHDGISSGVLRVEYQENAGALFDYFRALAARLRRVRVCCGDFERILGPSVTWRHGMTAVFLDPPYSDAEHAIEYSGGGAVWERVTDWCEANGDHPLLRIALCGYEGTWTPPSGWTAIPWRTPGGYGSQGNGRGRTNAAREVVWFSPACLTRIEDMPLFREVL